MSRSSEFPVVRLKFPKGSRNDVVPRPVSRPTRRVSVEQGYELWAPTYDRDPNPALALEERQLKPLLPSVKGKDVLDVACGTGRWLEKLLNLGARSGVGVDFSAAMLAAAGTKTALRGRLVRAECLSLPVRARRADLLMCSFLLAHLGDVAAFAGEVWRVAKPGADLFVTDLHPEAYAQGWHTSFRDESGTVEISTFARPLRQVVEVFTLHGFEPQQCIEANVDEPERRIFVQAGRIRSFEEARYVPAIFICHFRRPVS